MYTGGHNNEAAALHLLRDHCEALALLAVVIYHGNLSPKDDLTFSEYHNMELYSECQSRNY